MVFSDLFFLFVFIPSFVICYLLAAWVDKPYSNEPIKQDMHTRNMVLVIFSLIFYAWGEPVYVLLMLLSVLVNFHAGKRIEASDGPGRRKALVAGVAFNIAALAVFKYLDFLIGCVNSLGIQVPKAGIRLPIGISFYTFQSISYLADVYRRVSPPQKRFRDLLLYISMFPQLIAGPIVRYGTVASEILSRHVTSRDMADGISRFVTGLAKKVIIANQLSEISSSLLDGDLSLLGTSGAWTGLAAFTLQIYFDFSGYSDMAIGMGRCLGFHFNENFSHPYVSSSISEFWRRWHMSLGSFFRDYVYIPMGGNRKHQWVNILVVWGLTGLWHGASWNFVIWGLYFAAILMAEKHVIARWLLPSPRPLLHLYSIILIMIGWAIFYFDDMGRLTDFLSILFGGGMKGDDILASTAISDYFWLWAFSVMLCMPCRQWLEKRIYSLVTIWNAEAFLRTELAIRVALSVVILVVSAALLVGATNNAFLYTRF